MMVESYLGVSLPNHTSARLLLSSIFYLCRQCSLAGAISTAASSANALCLKRAWNKACDIGEIVKPLLYIALRRADCLVWWCRFHCSSARLLIRVFSMSDRIRVWWRHHVSPPCDVGGFLRVIATEQIELCLFGRDMAYQLTAFCRSFVHYQYGLKIRKPVESIVGYPDWHSPDRGCSPSRHFY